jgi:HK97 family phage portal protein
VILATTRGNAAVAAETRSGGWESFMPGPGAIAHGSLAIPFGMKVPAIASAVYLISETIAGFVLRTYRGVAERSQPDPGTWQGDLFQDPMPGVSSFQTWEDVIVSLELHGNAFVLKRRASNRVVGLEVIDPDYVSVMENRSAGTASILAWANGQTVDITREVIHIRGRSPIPAATQGIGRTHMHRNTIQGADDYERFRGAYFANDATPGIVLEVPGSPTTEQRRDLMRAWMRRHQGPDKRNMPALLTGGAKATHLAANMRDSQGAELADVIKRDVATMFNIHPAELLHVTVSGAGGSHYTPEAMADTFMRMTLKSRMRRIERALAADRDLFPDRNLYPRFDPSEFTRGDISTMASKVHQLVQVGAMTPNEGRADLGLPPHPDGDVLQITPVGGAPNPETPA